MVGRIFKKRLKAASQVFFGLCAVLLSVFSVSAETGMALIVKIDKVAFPYKIIWDDGPIMRIDLKDDQIVGQTQFAIEGYHVRFNPAGDKFAFLKRDNLIVYVADINGNLLGQFTYYDRSKGPWGTDAFGQRSLSWTNKGIYVWGKGRVVLFSEAGALIDSFTVKDSTGKVLGNSGRVASNADWAVSEEDDMIINVATRRVMRKISGDGCGWGISPDGSRITQNRWDSGMPHATMGIFINNNGVTTLERIYHIDSLMGLKKSPPGYVWNLQKWSGNSNDIFVVTVGPQQTQEGQIGNIGAPYIVNHRTKTAKNLRGSLPENVVWTITDFYQGKVPGATTPSVAVPSLSPNSGNYPGTTAKVVLNCATGDASLYYTTNGSTPSSSNGTLARPGDTITLTLSTTPLTLKVIAIKGTASSAVVSGTYTGSVLFAPEALPADTASGISFKYYRRSLTTLPDFGTLVSDSSGVLPTISVSGFPSTAFGVVLEGFIRIPSDGVQVFKLNSNDGAKLFVAGVLVIDNGGSRTAGLEKSGEIGLKAGWHKIKIEYFNQANDNAKVLSLVRGTAAVAATELVYAKSSPLKLTSPNGGELWTVGSKVRIRWTAPDNVTQVVLSLSTNGGLEFKQKITGSRTVSSQDSSWGDYLWTIPATLDGSPVCSEDAFILISNYQGPEEDQSDAKFSIRGCGTSVAGASASQRWTMGASALERQLSVTFKKDTRYTVDLYNAHGARLRSASFVYDGTVPFKMDGLTAGGYVLRVRNGDQRLVYRFMAY